MSYRISTISLENLRDHRENSGHSLNWPYPFVLPAWLDAWWGCFGDSHEQSITLISDDEQVIGIAPLMVREKTALFMGDTDVCDFQDFIVVPGQEKSFFRELLGYLASQDIEQMELKHVRPDSSVMTQLAPYARENGFTVTDVEEDSSMEMQLPGSFEDYLLSIDSKQRHEVRRKLRRIHKAGQVTYTIYERPEDISQAMNGFYRMFVESRDDKANFLTGRMKEFFDSLVRNLADIGIVRLGVLKLDDLDVAMVICFDYRDCRYLYNCGYNPEYTGLSVGLVSKVKTIEDSIERGLKTFDFLKGNETYKSRLGGNEVRLSSCRIKLT